MTYRIIVDDLSGPEIAELIRAHEALMLSQSPPGSCHFLLLDGLKSPDITMWTLWQTDQLLACGALKRFGEADGELKSMHTNAAARGKGLGRKMLDHITAEAVGSGIRKLWLETGAMDGFLPARQLYQSSGFSYCGPFGTYSEDPHSVFMCKSIA